jgi:DNA-binding CsgD family transcriptional regulator
MSGGKSERLRLSEVRAVFRLVGECRELGADHAAWRGHLAARLGGLVGGQVGMVGELAPPTGPATPGRLLSAVHVGWLSAQARAIWASYLASGEYVREPVHCAMQALVSRKGLCSRDQAVEDREWFASAFYNDALRASELDEMLVSFRDLPGCGRQNGIFLFRPRGGAVFRRRERRLVGLLHRDLGRHFGAALATLDDPNPSGLAPRLRETLRCLLEGDGEKQVAARLGVSTLTVHDYVKSLYRHFGVASRPELLAYFLRRSGLRLPGPDDPACENKRGHSE